MWTRADLKARGKADFTRNYWPCVLISLIILILVGGGSGFGSNLTNKFSHSNSTTYNNYYDDDYDDEYYDSDDYDSDNSLDDALSSSLAGAIVAAIAGISLLFACVGIAFSIFVSVPLSIGGRRFYLENQYEKGKISRIGYIFKKAYYGNTVLTLFLRNLFISLWSLLLIVPGIVKSYSYWMMEYIMAENPTLSHQRAFEISKKTMNGQKWDVFVLDLSFIPWTLLSIITCGLVGVFYVNSYMDATKAQLYGFLRMNALNQGFATPDELPGYFPQADANQ